MANRFIFCPVYPRNSAFTEGDCTDASQNSSVNSLCHAYRCPQKQKACFLCVKERENSLRRIVYRVDPACPDKGLCSDHLRKRRAVELPSQRPMPLPIRDTWHEPQERVVAPSRDYVNPELVVDQWRKKHESRRPPKAGSFSTPAVVVKNPPSGSSSAAASARARPVRPEKMGTSDGGGTQLTPTQRRDIEEYFHLHRQGRAVITTQLLAEMLDIPHDSVTSYWNELLAASK